MENDQPFIDYYAILRVDPSCDAKILESAYRLQAKRYHPDHHETADLDKFSAVVEAYRVLRNAEERARYDILHAANTDNVGYTLRAGDELDNDTNAALEDAETHAKILLHLYKARRTNAQNAGVIGYFVQQMLNCSDEQFEFHRWYLKAKGFIETTEQGGLAITIEGVDHVISMSRTSMREKLLIAQAGDRDGAGPS